LTNIEANKNIYKNYFPYNLYISLKNLLFAVKKSYTSLFQVNITNLNNQIKKWHNEVPSIKPYYAVKSLPYPSILKHLAHSDVNFDCASSGEIKSVLKYSFPQNIVYANPNKSKDDIIYASNKKVDCMVVDSIEEIKKMDCINPNLKKIIRIKSYEKDSDIKFNSKFGASNEEVFQMLNYLKNNKKTFEGFSFHVGSMCKNIEAYPLTIKTIMDNYYNFCENNKMPIKTIDIGGGFTHDMDLRPLNKLPVNNIKFIAEPGRFFSQTAIDLYCKVISVKKRNNCYHITINDSVYSTFNGKIYDGQKFKPIPMYNNDEMVDCVIFGQSCDSIDVIVQQCRLPLPKLDDVIKFEAVGAYSLSNCEGRFNGFQRTKELK